MLALAASTGVRNCGARCQLTWNQVPTTAAIALRGRVCSVVNAASVSSHHVVTARRTASKQRG